MKMCFVDICELVLFTDCMLSELIKKPFNTATVVYAMIQIFKRRVCVYLVLPTNKVAINPKLHITNKRLLVQVYVTVCV